LTRAQSDPNWVAKLRSPCRRRGRRDEKRRASSVSFSADPAMLEQAKACREFCAGRIRSLQSNAWVPSQPPITGGGWAAVVNCDDDTVTPMVRRFRQAMHDPRHDLSAAVLPVRTVFFT